MSRGIKQSTSVNKKRVVYDGVIIDRCWDCGSFQAMTCTTLGLMLPYPISGPVHTDCPLPKAPEAE